MGFGKDGKGAIIRENLTITLGGLASGSAITGTALVLGAPFRILKSEIFAHCDALTAGDGQGLLLGIANGELSAADIAGCLTTNGPLDFNDRSGLETAERNVKVLSATEFRDTAATSRSFSGEDGGPMITSKHRWTYGAPEAWDWFVFNDGPTITTGAVVRIVVVHFGMWIK